MGAEGRQGPPPPFLPHIFHNLAYMIFMLRRGVFPFLTAMGRLRSLSHPILLPKKTFPWPATSTD